MREPQSESATQTTAPSYGALPRRAQHYPRTLAAIYGDAGEAAQGASEAWQDEATVAGAPEIWSGEATYYGAVDGESASPDAYDEAPPLLERPPPGAPSVRPSAAGPSPARAIDQGALEQTAESLLLSANPDGSTSFDIAVRDEVFADLRCRITIDRGKVRAEFHVHDVNTRRLLEAEAGRLRAQLENRGLRVEEVRVVVA